MRLQFPKSVPLANMGTRIEKLERLTHALGGPEIYIKRDDETGSDLSGNKVRKLEFVIADAQAKGADTLVTCGGIQSNHARATAIIGARLGMKSFLVLRGDETDEYDGNLFLDKLVGAEFKFITEEEYEIVDDIMADVAKELRVQGRSPYIIPEGASNEIGVWGYIKAAKEIKDQIGETSLHIDHIVCAVGSGGTHAGLLLGSRLFGIEAEIVSLNVGKTADYFVDRIYGIIKKTEEQFGLERHISRDEIRVIDGYVGEGYALSRPEEIHFIEEIAKLEGIILDPVYTGKALFGLVDQIRKGRFSKEAKILFIHTGGIFGLFPKRDMFFRVKRKDR